jgi:hypothetical protein
LIKIIGNILKITLFGWFFVLILKMIKKILWDIPELENIEN